MAERDYDVGYKKPPKEHRFKPGKSGNPKGRPKGSRSFGEEIRAFLRAPVAITENGRRRTITMREAVLKRLGERAIKAGDLPAIKHLLVLADTHAEPVEAETMSEEDQVLLEQALKRLSGDQ